MSKETTVRRFTKDDIGKQAIMWRSDERWHSDAIRGVSDDGLLVCMFGNKPWWRKHHPQEWYESKYVRFASVQESKQP